MRRQGQAHSLTVEEACVYKEVGTCTILICFVPAHILFESSASYCFTLFIFNIQHTIPYITLDSWFDIIIGNGINVSSKPYRYCPVMVCNREFHANLLVLDH